MNYGQSETITALTSPTDKRAIIKEVESDLKSGLTELAIIALVVVIYGRFRPPQALPYNVDTYLGTPAIFALVVIASGLLGGLGLPQVPKRVEKLQKNPIARFLFMTAIAYAGTSDLELSLMTTGVFAALMYVLRTPEERAKVPYFV